MIKFSLYLRHQYVIVVIDSLITCRTTYICTFDLVLWSSCLTSKVLISIYLATSMYMYVCKYNVHFLKSTCSLCVHCRSGSAYETLRQSGCLRLPSQRTLRDYTHYVKAWTGFSSEVDEMLVNAANLMSCPEREKYVLLLLDEMHIRQDLVFDKHSGEMIGFCSLGDINEHLVQFEQSLSEGGNTSENQSPKLAKTMMVFMVRGLFSKLQFPYAQFPCADLSGEMLYKPFWEAVGRLETCGLKVRSL